MIKTIYFDLGNVLVFFSNGKMLAQLAECTGLAEPQIRQFLFETTLREDYEKGKIKTNQLYERFQKISEKKFSLSQFRDAVSHIFTPNLELWPLVEKLKKEKIRLVLLSNTSECHYTYIRANYPILQFFDHEILSFEVGAWKPDPLIFQKALEVAECKPEECFYTDDIPEFIFSAQQVGLPGEVFTSVNQLQAALKNRGLKFLEVNLSA